MKTYYRFFYGILCLIIVTAFTSCEIVYEALLASADFNNQSYSYDGQKSSGSETALGANMGYIFKDTPFGNPFSSSMYNDPTDNGLTADVTQEMTLEKTSHNALKLPQKSFKESIAIMSGGELVTKRSKDGNTNISLIYLEVPIYAIYNYDLNAGTIYGGLGPYFAYGLGGKIKSSSGDKVNSFDKDEGFKRFDAGIGITGGYQFESGISAYLGFDIGLVNLERDGGDFQAHNNTFSLNFLYPLSKI